ncbi:hypothetical protein DFH29DRAFT_211207 [Suillus ampliporus]|nr:hypothetical protein DFH29DRAFT_211207 [Suillus ampliporus]
MDLLWADMNGILPFLGCVTRLHPMIYLSTQVSADESMQAQCSFFSFICSPNISTQHSSWSQGVEPLSESECRQFLRHSARVRSLTVSTDEDCHLLTRIPIETCVFPRLLSLSLIVMNTRRLHFLLSPALRRCHIDVLQSDLKSIGTLLCCSGGLNHRVHWENSAAV